jgi:hypothetical protein
MTTKEEIEAMAKQLAEELINNKDMSLEEIIKDNAEELDELYNECLKFLTELDKSRSK